MSTDTLHKHTTTTAFVSALLMSANMMTFDGATGGVYAIADTKVGQVLVPLDPMELLHAESDTLYEHLEQYRIIIFDGGCIHGDDWVHTYYPIQLVETKVTEKQI